MGGLSRIGGTLLVLALAAGAAPRPAQTQVLSGAVGALAGTAAGGYITLSIVVARAQFGHYLHDYYDLFDWKSVPIIVGAGTGTAVGILQPSRLWSGLIFGAGGTALGAGLGFVIGNSVSDQPEGKWAGAAIGAGAGMAVGTIVGLLLPQKQIVPEEVREAAVIPIGFRVRVP